MQYRSLGKTGLQTSVLSFGSWVTFSKQVDQDLALRLMSLAYEHGVNFFDNAEVYAQGQSELIMGHVLKKAGWGRDTFIVSSKVFWGGEKPTQIGLSKKHVYDACHAALQRLQVDYLDLYFCHRPDPNTPIEETVFAMNDLITQGKILYWGTSEWKPSQLKKAYEFAERTGLRGPSMEQPEYNLFNRTNVEVDLKPIIEEHGLGTTIWSPLCSGLLTGKYQEGIPPGSRYDLAGYEWLKNNYKTDRIQARLEKIAEFKKLIASTGATLAQASIAWCLYNPHVSTVILGASRMEQLEENLASLKFVHCFDTALLDAIDALFIPE